MLPRSISDCIHEFNKLPGIGPKTAERFVFYLLKRPSSELQSMARAILGVKNNLTLCKKCYQYASNSLCPICSDSNRDKTKLCVVAYSYDIPLLEKTGTYNGMYFVLGGVVDHIGSISVDDLRLHEIEDRMRKDPSLEEIILATNPDLDGETTALYLIQRLKLFHKKITRLARGLPMGADIGYADEITLRNAIQGRREI